VPDGGVELLGELAHLHSAPDGIDTKWYLMPIHRSANLGRPTQTHPNKHGEKLVACYDGFRNALSKCIAKPLL